MRRLSLLLWVLLTAELGLAQTALPPSAPLDVAAVDAVVARTLKAFDVPGIAVAVVKHGQVVMAKGYGVRSLKTKEPVDTNTLFGITSCTKAFTAAALGLLVDEGKLRWDDKVTTHIPEFKMYDPYVTAEFTVRDLLCHRSGLGRGTDNLMQLLPYRGNTYVVRWKDRTIDADAFTAFALDAQGRAASMKMDDILHAPSSDFKYLDLQRVE